MRLAEFLCEELVYEYDLHIRIHQHHDVVALLGQLLQKVDAAGQDGIDEVGGGGNVLRLKYEIDRVVYGLAVHLFRHEYQVHGPEPPPRLGNVPGIADVL